MPSPVSVDSDRGASPPKVVVVGGGISGLAAAHAVVTRRPDVELILLEAGPRLGGKLRVGELAGHPVDLGAEAMLNRRPEAVELARAVGLADDLVVAGTAAAGVWTRGAIHPLPRTVLGVPADLTALGASGIVGRRAVPRARLERFMRHVDVSEDVGIGRLVAHRLGGEIRDRLVEPLLGGVYAGRADDLSLLATAPQLVAALQEHGGLLAAAAAGAPPSGPTAEPPAPVFAGLVGGVGRLAGAVANALRAAGADVRIRTTVRELARADGGFRLVAGPTIAPETIEADAVVLATPAAATTRLLRAVAPRAATELGQVDSASMAVVSLALEATDPPLDLAGSGFLVPPIDGREIKGATFSSRKWDWHPAGLDLVRCSIGRYGEERQLHLDDTELVSSALLDLRDAVGVTGRLVDAVVTRWGGALPQYTVGHLDRVARVRAAVAGVPGLALCGAAYSGVGIPACIASGTDAATLVLAGLRGRDTMPR